MDYANTKNNPDCINFEYITYHNISLQNVEIGHYTNLTLLESCLQSPPLVLSLCFLLVKVDNGTFHVESDPETR